MAEMKDAVADKLGIKKSQLTHNGSKLKDIAKKLVHTQFQQNWQWVVEFSDTGNIKCPADFDLYCKEIEHGGLTIEFEDKQIGANTISSPVNKSCGSITLQIRDNEDARCEGFFKKLGEKVINKDGTVNLPVDYLFKLLLYRFNDKGEKKLYNTYQVALSEYGGFTRGRDEVGAFVTYPVVFKKYQAL